MPAYFVETARERYPCVVERGVLARLNEHIPARAGKVFVASNEEVWRLHGPRLQSALAGRNYEVLFFPPGEVHKRFSSVEAAAEHMVQAGADRSSVVIAFGGGIVNDMGGFLAASFMRGVPVIQVPTTLLAQVDAAIGGKTGVNLERGKNLLGAFHQPLAVLLDPGVLDTLPEREYRAGLFEVIKYGVISSPELFTLLADHAADVLAHAPGAVDRIVAESVRIKCEVVSADEKEGDLRRILNFGHTVGHALEAETRYERFLHGEAVAFGMRAATCLAANIGLLTPRDCERILDAIARYGPIPPLDGITADALVGRLRSDKKTIQGKVHFILPDRIGHVVIRSDVPAEAVREAVGQALR